MAKIMSASLMMFLCCSNHIVCSEKIEQRVAKREFKALKREQKAAKKEFKVLKKENDIRSDRLITSVISNNNKSNFTIGLHSTVAGSISGEEGCITFNSSYGSAVADVSSSVKKIQVCFLEDTHHNSAVLNLSWFGNPEILVESKTAISPQENIVTVYSGYNSKGAMALGGARVSVQSSLRVFILPSVAVGVIGFFYWMMCRK